MLYIIFYRIYATRANSPSWLSCPYSHRPWCEFAKKEKHQRKTNHKKCVIFCRTNKIDKFFEQITIIFREGYMDRIFGFIINVQFLLNAIYPLKIYRKMGRI